MAQHNYTIDDGNRAIHGLSMSVSGDVYSITFANYITAVSLVVVSGSSPHSIFYSFGGVVPWIPSAGQVTSFRMLPINVNTRQVFHLRPAVPSPVTLNLVSDDAPVVSIMAGSVD